MHNLLTKPCIRVRMDDGGLRRIDLPRTLRLLAADRIASFQALRAHQQHPWHALLAQLAALACDQAGDCRLPEERSEWEERLRDLTPSWRNDVPWHLVPKDERSPGFLQPAGHENYRREPKVLATPDGIDILNARMNHEIKTKAAAAGDTDDWLFALVTAQTAGGYSGSGSYGVSRMNRGHTSRLCLGLRPAAGGPGAWFRHDVARLRAEWAEHPRRPRAAPALLWLLPWDGDEQLDLDTLHPGYIEVCKRIRLVSTPGGIEARTRTSTKTRIDAADRLGNVGDHWLPVEAGGGKALTLGDRGFRYDALSAILGPEYAPHGAMRTGGGKGPWRLVARGIARRQGKTAGYYERNDIVVDAALAGRLGTAAGRAEVGVDAEALLKVAQDTSNAVWAATHRLASRKRQLKKPPATTRRQIERLESHIDGRFFGALDALASTVGESGRQEVVDAFRSELATAARALVEAAIREAGGGGRDRHLSRAAARERCRACCGGSGAGMQRGSRPPRRRRDDDYDERDRGPRARAAAARPDAREKRHGLRPGGQGRATSRPAHRATLAVVRQRLAVDSSVAEADDGLGGTHQLVPAGAHPASASAAERKGRPKADTDS